MSGIAIAALAAATVWMAALTVAILAVIRETSVLSVWAQEQSHTGRDGPEIGTSLASEAVDLVPDLAASLGYVVFLGGDCQPCREFAVEASRSEELEELGGGDSLKVYAVVTGIEKQVADMKNVLPSWIKVVSGRDANILAGEFEIHTTPAVYEVERGNVTGSAVAGYGVVNFLNLIRARSFSDASDFAGDGTSRESQTQAETLKVSQRG